MGDDEDYNEYADKKDGYYQENPYESQHGGQQPYDPYGQPQAPPQYDPYAQPRAPQQYDPYGQPQAPPMSQNYGHPQAPPQSYVGQPQAPYSQYGQPQAPVVYNQVPYSQQPYTAVPMTQPMMMAPIAVVPVGDINESHVHCFLVSNICFCLLSLLFWPFVLVPMIMGIMYAQDINRARANGLFSSLFASSVVFTLVCAFLFLGLIIAAAVFTFGIGVIFLVLLIPYFVIVSLHGTAICGYRPARFDYSGR